MSRKGLIHLVSSAVAIAGLAFGFQVIAPAQACACGAFAPPNGLDGQVSLTSEAAIISIQGNQETVEMRLGIDSLTAETGLIFPTPSPAQVSLGSVEHFTSIGQEMTPEVIVTHDWWSWEWFWKAGGADGTPPSGGAPLILDQVQLGPIQATTLAADDLQGLTDWLAAQDYGIRPEVSSLLQSYIDKGWYFVALKLTGEVPLDGELDPIIFTFTSEQLVYPLALSQAAEIEQWVFLYVFADQKQDIAFANDSYLNAEVVWARAVRDPDLQAYGAYLTAFSMYFYNPVEEITDDLVLFQANNDNEVNTIRYTTYHANFLGIPMGWFLIMVGAIGAFVTWRIVAKRARQKAKMVNL